MHITLAWVITQDSRHYNGLLAFCEPAIWTEPGSRLRWRRWHHEERSNPNDQCQKTSNYDPVSYIAFKRDELVLLDKEQPPPPRFAFDTAHVEDTKSDETRNDATDIGRHPKERKPNRKLCLGIKIYYTALSESTLKQRRSGLTRQIKD